MRPQTSLELGKRSLVLLLCLALAGNDVSIAIPAICGHSSALVVASLVRRCPVEEVLSAQALTPAPLLRLHSLHEKLSIRIDGLLGKLVRHFAETPSAARPPQDQTATIFEREYMVAAPSPSLRYLHAAALGPRVALVIWDEKTHSGAVAQLHAEAGLKSALRDGVLYQLVRKMKSNPADLRVQIVGGNRSRKTDRLAAEIRKYLDANGIARVNDRHGQSGPDSIVLDLETGNLSPVDPGFIRDLPAEVIARPPIATFSYNPPTPVDPRSRLNNYVVPLDPVNNIDRARQDRGRFLSAKLREKITIGKTRAPILQAHLEELVAKKRIDLGRLSIGELTQALLSTGEMLGKSPAEISPDDIRFIVQEYGDSDPTVSHKAWYVDLIRYPPGVLLNRWKRIFTGHILQMYVIIALGKTSHALGMDVFFGPFLADWWNKRMGKLDADHQALIRSTRSSIGLSDRDDTLLTLEALTRSEELSPAMRRVLRQMTMDNDVRVAEAAREALEHTSPMLSPEKGRLRTLDDDAPWPGEPGRPSVQVPETWLAPDADLLIPDKTLGDLFPFRPAAVPRTEALHRLPLLQAAPSRDDAFDAGPTTPFKYAPFLDLLAILNDLDLDLDLEPQIRAASTLEEIQRILKVDATTVKIFRAELIEKNARRMGTIYGSDSSSGGTPKAPASLAYWIVLAYTGDVGKAVRWGGRWLGGHPLERLAGLLGGTALAVFAPALWWIPLAFWGVHLIVEDLIAMGWTRAPPEYGRQALRPRAMFSRFGILSAYGAPALAMSFARDSLLNLPIDHALILGGVALVSAALLWIVAHAQGRHDRRAFALSQQRQQVSPLGQTPLPLRLRLDWESLRRPFDPDDLDILSEPMVTHAGISLGIMTASLAMISWVILSFIDETFRIHERLGIPRQPGSLATLGRVLELSVIGLLVPAAEELLKNFFALGMSHNWLKRKTGFSSRTVFLLSAFVVNSLWAVSHYFVGDQREAWKYFDVVAMGMMLMDGMIYSAAYWKTSNWSISAIAHCVRNGIAVVIMLAAVASISTPYKLAASIFLGPVLWVLHNFLRPHMRSILDRPTGLVRNQHRFPSRLKRDA